MSLSINYSKVCRQCKIEKTLSDFYCHPGMLDGHLNICKTCKREYRKQYYQKDPDRNYQNTVAWKRKNPENVLVYRQRWNQANRVYKAQHQHRRRALMAQLPCTLTQDDWEDILWTYDYRCAHCSCCDIMLEQDHYIPLTRGGGYTIDNIVPACRSCNARKGNKLPSNWRE